MLKKDRVYNSAL